MAAEADIFEPEAPAFLAPEEEAPAAPVGLEKETPADMPEEGVADASLTAPGRKDEPMPAASGSCGADVTWNLAGGVLTISGTGPMTDYRAQMNFENGGTHAPWYGEYVTTVVIGEGVTTIGNVAFTELTQLTSVTIPNSVTEIGNGAFDGCANLPSITLPNGLKGIGMRAFADCRSLKSITLPDTVTTVNLEAFTFCTGLTSVRLSSAMKSIAMRLFAGCSALRTVSIPSGTGITTIGEGAFDSCVSLQSFEFPDTLTTIGNGAFQGCTSLKSVTLPASVKTINDEAFANCTSLSEVIVLGSSVTAGSTAFQNTPWLRARGDFVVEGGMLVSYQGPGGSVSIPNTVTTIGKRAFTGRSDVTAVTIPGSVTAIGEWAFGETGLRSVTIPEGVTSIGNDAFAGCLSLANVSISSTVRSIGDEAFWACQALTEVTIPEGVRTIGAAAFRDCTALHTVSIPSTVTAVGDYAFASYKLRKLIVNGAVFTYNEDELPPALIVYGSGAGIAQAYAASMGVTYADMSRQHLSGWVTEDGYTYCYEDGKRAADEWRIADGAYKRLDGYGRMMVGLQNILCGGYDDGIYYFNSQGAMQVGWQNVRGSWYYFNQAHDGRYGAALTGWVRLGNAVYYMDPDTAVMYTGWHNINGKRYYFSDGSVEASGVMAVGWKQIDGIWYLFKGDGSFVRQAQTGDDPKEIQPPAGGTGWRYVPETGDYYYFKDYVRKGDYWVGFADGASKWANNWYYADATGCLLTGFQYLDDLKGGKGWYMLQVDDTNNEIGKMLDGWQWTYSDAGTGYFSPKYGSQGLCTYTSEWGDYNASTGLWSDGLAHRGA